MFAVHLKTPCLRKSGKLWLLPSPARDMIMLSFCNRWTISEDYVAVFFTVQFGSQSRGYINRQIRILRWGCQENIAILNLTAFVVFKKFTHNEISWFDIQTDAWTKWKVTNAVFDDAVGGFEAARLRWIQGQYCRSDSAYRLGSRLEGPHQLPSFSSLAFLRNCNIFCFWNGQR